MEINPYKGEWIPTVEDVQAELESLARRREYLENLLDELIRQNERLF